MKFISVSIEFDEDEEYYVYRGVRVLENTIPVKARLGIAESMAQSDYVYINLPNDIIDAIGEDNVN